MNLRLELVWLGLELVCFQSQRKGLTHKVLGVGSAREGNKVWTTER